MVPPSHILFLAGRKVGDKGEPFYLVQWGTASKSNGGRLCPDGMLCTPARLGPTFPCAKVGKTQSWVTGSPLTNPFLSLAVLDTNDVLLHRPYGAQIRSQGSHRRIGPTPYLSPAAGERSVYPTSC